MGLVTEAKRVLDGMPPRLREGISAAAAWLPRPMIYGSRFRRTRALIAETEFWPAERLEAWRDERIRDLVSYAFERVPYYRRVMTERGVEPRHVLGLADLELLPLISKEDIRDSAEEMLAQGLPPTSRERISTGGTSGQPLHFWIDRNRSSFEWAFMTWQWRSAGYRLGDRRAVLRGAVIQGADAGTRYHEIHPLLDEITLSTFHLSEETLPHYLAAMKAYGARFLHAYPSSAASLASLLQQAPGRERPQFQAILLGSENVYPSQRRQLEETFRTRVYAWYGHSEKCLLGGGCEHSDDYHIFPQYGALEVVDESGDRVGPGSTGRLVGTSFMNRVMPLIRYATDDRGTLMEGDCLCGRAYPRLTGIEGRWHGEILYGTGGSRITMTALNTHADVFERVRRFRIRQEKPGEAIVLVVPGEGFGDEDCLKIADEYDKRAGGSIRFAARVVDELPLTKRGKFKFVDQLIDESGSVSGES
jgi:phenylacetate-CoA ligase